MKSALATVTIYFSRQIAVVYGETKKDVQDSLSDLKSKAKSGVAVAPARLTVADFVSQWLENTARPQIHAVTYRRYEQIVRFYIRESLGGIRLDKFDAMQVESYYADLERRGASASARKRAGQLLARALHHAVKRRLISQNPVTEVAKPREVKKEMMYLTKVQVGQFLDAAKSNRLYALFALAVGSGMRQGELFALRWSDIDFAAATVTVRRSLTEMDGKYVVKEPKSKAALRTITLPPFAIDALKKHRARMLAEGNINSSVFCTRPGHFLGKSGMIRFVFKPILKRAELPPIRFHDLRHTHASLLLSDRHSVAAVAKRLGHAKPDMTLRVYTHVLPTDDQVLADGLKQLYA